MMRFNRIVARAIIATVSAAAILSVTMLSILIFLFPHTMMDLTYSLGMDKASIKYAVASYERFERIEFIEKAADTALKAKLYDKADECIERLIQDENFESFCEEKNATIGDAEELQGATYQAYYMRQLCISKYYVGETSKAIDRALELMGATFVSGNPLEAVLVEAYLDGKDSFSTVQYAYEKMTEIVASDVYTAYSMAEKTHFDKIYSTVQSWVGEAE